MAHMDDDWNQRLNQIKQLHQCKTEVQLSNLIGVSQAMLAHVRTARRPLPISSKFKVLSLLNVEFDLDALLTCLSDSDRQTFIALRDKRP
jgi:hypothetical protein